MRILLAEDDALLADGLARALRQFSYIVDQVGDGASADAWLESQDYDLVILDLGLPRLEGSDVLRRLRGRRQTLPVLILSARDALEERVRLLNLGADDYLVKPVALSELEARVRALIRRGRALPDPVLQLGALRLDTGGKRAFLADTPLELTAREWMALEFLATRANRIISKEQIIDALYGWNEDISPNALEKLLSRLRAKLEPGGVLIRAVRGLGYYLECTDATNT
ncbi:response regulator [Rhodocyclus tenuis]|uniref:Response regulator n=2 Tax=Rhodocyclus TaxID=1064 RepID=A0A6L5JYM1_RHOTE|nr:response regulator [Rhodocyclus gracilis]MQY51680.1 response regulator [Rhodocyclus gracilis]MRD73161.1 response regulator [Rhodocyclus gracilis]NJA89059.1 response regulator [Rhodocyclus gracilis]